MVPGSILSRRKNDSALGKARLSYPNFLVICSPAEVALSLTG